MRIQKDRVNQRSEIRSQKSEVRGQRSEVRGQRSEVRTLPFFAASCEAGSLQSVAPIMTMLSPLTADP
ncbi:MAG: hypothetical protein FWC38_00285 [Proteobacteria bacterium]|nr:hypothetical protein [Pseudomonadota bacterium]